jgi:flavin reductase (DIM6/NTAB) family NADH-FMN oxidoreductase RutF
MSKIKWKGGALIAPVPPAMISCMGSDGKPNIITVAWTGILSTHPPKTYISVRPSRHSYGLIKESGEFVINLTSKELTRAADLCGMKTGKKIDKFKECNLTAEFDENFSEFSCPSIAESLMSIYCKVDQVIPLGSHDMFIADIVGIGVDERLIDETGKLCLDKAGLTAFAHGEYFELGKKIGAFGFSVAKKKKKKTAPPAKK